MENAYEEYLYSRLTNDEVRLMNILLSHGCVERYELRNLMYLGRMEEHRHQTTKDYGTYMDMMVAKLSTCGLVQKGEPTENGTYVALTEPGYNLALEYIGKTEVPVSHD